jgi:hypothetical protein
MKLLKSISFLAIAATFLFGLPALADDTNCSTRRIGERCWQKFRADAGKSASTSDNKDTGKLTKQVPSGYVVIGYTEKNESSNGGSFTSESLAGGGKTSLLSESSSSYNRLNEIKNMLDQLVKFPNPKTGQQQEIRAKIDQLSSELLSIQSSLRSAINANSNIDVFVLQAKSAYVCTKKVAGNCLDGYGNHGKGYVQANLIYVGGSSNEVSRISQQTLNLQKAFNDSQAQTFFAPPYLPDYHAKYPMFDAQWYLSNNSDVNNACKGNLECAKQHYLANGLKECRNASRFFNPRWYLENNPDVKSVFKDCRGASEHWSGAGRRERRPGATGVPAP